MVKRSSEACICRARPNWVSHTAEYLTISVALRGVGEEDGCEYYLFLVASSCEGSRGRPTVAIAAPLDL